MEQHTVDDHLSEMITAAIVAERERTANLILQTATRRHSRCGPGDELVLELTALANGILDPAR